MSVQAVAVKKKRARSRALEKKLQGRLVVALRKLGFFVSHTSQPQRSFCAPGLPDLFAAHRGWKLVVWIEVKAEKNKLSTSQLIWHAKAREAGVNVVTAWSLDDLIRELKALGAPIT